VSLLKSCAIELSSFLCQSRMTSGISAELDVAVTWRKLSSLRRHDEEEGDTLSIPVDTNRYSCKNKNVIPLSMMNNTPNCGDKVETSRRVILRLLFQRNLALSSIRPQSYGDRNVGKSADND
jgi:hypothetical protein